MIGEDISKDLVYSTVRLTCFNEKTISRGTSFFMTYEFENTNITALVTNKHVVCEDEGKTVVYKNAKFVISCIENGNIKDDKKVEFIIDDLDKRIVFHDNQNADLCFIFVNDKISESIKLGNNIYYRSLNTNLIINDEYSKTLKPIEDVIMIGYPIGLIDEYNNKPIVRKGITATSYSLDYNGKKEFLIDIACYQGSSGSPVFIRQDGLGKEQTANGLTIGLTTSYAFLGVLYAGQYNVVEGEIGVSEISCKMVPISKTKVMINLGCVIKPCRIMELFEKVRNAQQK